MNVHQLAHTNGTALRVALARLLGLLESRGERTPPMLAAKVAVLMDEYRDRLEQYADTLDADGTAPPVRQARGAGTQTASG